jgi:hypothetical protein
MTANVNKELRRRSAWACPSLNSLQINLGKSTARPVTLRSVVEGITKAARGQWAGPAVAPFLPSQPALSGHAALPKALNVTNLVSSRSHLDATVLRLRFLQGDRPDMPRRRMTTPSRGTVVLREGALWEGAASK